MASVGQECRHLAGWFCLGSLLRLPSEDSRDWGHRKAALGRESVIPRQLTHRTGKVVLASSLNFCFLPCEASWTSLWHSDWIPAEGVIQEMGGEGQKRQCLSWPSLGNYTQSLLSYFVGQQASSDSVYEETTQKHEKTRKRKWRTFGVWLLHRRQFISGCQSSDCPLISNLSAPTNIQWLPSNLFPICSLLLIMDNSDSFSRPC